MLDHQNFMKLHSKPYSNSFGLNLFATRVLFIEQKGTFAL